MLFQPSGLLFSRGDLVDGGGHETASDCTSGGDQLVLEFGEDLGNPHRVLAPVLDAHLVVLQAYLGEVHADHAEGFVGLVIHGLDGYAAVVVVCVADETEGDGFAKEVDGYGVHGLPFRCCRVRRKVRQGR